MKKYLLIFLFSLFSVISSGQDGSALKFLGIPIDGTESHFVSQLKGKGFTYDSTSESYKGQFNGANVNVFIHTNHNLVDRVYVAFPSNTEEGIKVEYNHLLSQFKENKKYLDLVMNEDIPIDDDISYEMSVNKKRYQASFCYFDTDRDPIAFMDAMLDNLSDFFTAEQMAVLKEYAKKTLDASQDEREALEADMMAKMQNLGLGQGEDTDADSGKAILFLASLLDGMRSLADGDVWFMIHENFGRYNIGLYYDNLHNQAHGEDL